MARITVEDCLKNVDNRFDLVIKASARAHALEMGAVDPLVPRDNDKPTVIALREIAAGFDVAADTALQDELRPKKPSFSAISSAQSLSHTHNADDNWI